MARVLIVDDEKSIRTTLHLFLSEAGHEVSTSENAEEALLFLDQNKVDIVVTDIVLPEKTGTELFRRICETYPRVKVILITGEPNLSSAMAALRLGAFDYLVKPVRKDQILQAVAKAAWAFDLEEANQRLAAEAADCRQKLEKLAEARAREARLKNDTLQRMILDPLQKQTKPMLESLKQSNLSDRQKVLMDALESDLNQVISQVIGEIRNTSPQENESRRPDPPEKDW